MKLDAKLESMSSRDAFSKSSDHAAKARKVASDEHTRLQRELQTLRSERGLTKGDGSFDSAWQHRGNPLARSPRTEGEASESSTAPDGEPSTRGETKVQFRSPRTR
jgi:hypothetical protein